MVRLGVGRGGVPPEQQAMRSPSNSLVSFSTLFFLGANEPQIHCPAAQNRINLPLHLPENRTKQAREVIGRAWGQPQGDSDWESLLSSACHPHLSSGFAWGILCSCLTSAPRTATPVTQNTQLSAQALVIHQPPDETVPFPPPVSHLFNMVVLKWGEAVQGQRPRITAEVNCLGGSGPKQGHGSLRN